MSTLLHVLNGDCTKMLLEHTDIPGDTLVWADVLHDGPAPADAAADEWRRLRARHLAASGNGHGGEARILAQLRKADETLQRYAEFDEVVFWFEHDVFDQLLLIRHLHWLSGIEDRSGFRLICIDQFPGHPDFGGLGELTPAELATLFPERRRISDAEVALGAALWRAYGAADPRHFSDLVTEGDTSVLPFVAGALTRQLEDFPSTVDGLARTERQILNAVRNGHRTGTDVFVKAGGLEERVFMGDTTLWTWLHRMTAGRAPLMSLDGEFRPEGAPTGVFALTATAEAVLAGKADYIAVNGIDRWMGGMHLTDGRYRWDGSRVIRLEGLS